MAAAVSDTRWTQENPAPLIVIVGPTASGKTDIALRLAANLDGEIIAADSRTVYRGLDIGTAKPSKEERERIPHHLIDIVDPGEPYSAARFQADARAAVSSIRGRGRIPLIVGGSGLYVDGLLYDYAFGPAANLERRHQLESLTIDELLAHCRKNTISIPENSQNKRYLIRAIEQGGVNNRKREIPLYNTIIVGIATDKEVLASRIQERAARMFADGLVNEAQSAGERYGWDIDPLRAPAYRASKDLIEGIITTEEAIERLIRGDKQLAKKQRTWFRRNEHITWLEAKDMHPFITHAVGDYRKRATLKT